MGVSPSVGGMTVSGALDVLTNYITLLHDCPQYFSETSAEEARAIGSQLAHAVLPWRDRHGRRVNLYRAGNWNPDKYTFAQCYKLGYMLSELMALEPKTQVRNLPECLILQCG